MVDFTSYIAPLIVAGIAGFTLTSTAFDKLYDIMQQAVTSQKKLFNISNNTVLIKYLNEEQKILDKKLEISELFVVVFYCIAEILIIFPYLFSLYTQYFNQGIQSNLNIWFISLAYISILLAFFISAISYIYVIHFNIHLVLPRILKSEKEIINARLKIS